MNKIKKIDFNAWLPGEFDSDPCYFKEITLDDLSNYGLAGKLTLRKIEKACKKLAHDSIDRISYITMYITLDNNEVYSIWIDDDTCDPEDKNIVLKDSYSIKEFEETFLNIA